MELSRHKPSHESEREEIESKRKNPEAIGREVEEMEEKAGVLLGCEMSSGTSKEYIKLTPANSFPTGFTHRELPLLYGLTI